MTSRRRWSVLPHYLKERGNYLPLVNNLLEQKNNLLSTIYKKKKKRGQTPLDVPLAHISRGNLKLQNTATPGISENTMYTKYPPNQPTQPSSVCSSRESANREDAAVGANARTLDAVSCASPFVVPKRKRLGAEYEMYMNIHAVKMKTL
jgi:hypothetical protein